MRKGGGQSGSLEFAALRAFYRLLGGCFHPYFYQLPHFSRFHPASPCTPCRYRIHLYSHTDSLRIPYAVAGGLLGIDRSGGRGRARGVGGGSVDHGTPSTVSLPTSPSPAKQRILTHPCISRPSHRHIASPSVDARMHRGRHTTTADSHPHLTNALYIDPESLEPRYLYTNSIDVYLCMDVYAYVYVSMCLYIFVCVYVVCMYEDVYFMWYIKYVSYEKRYQTWAVYNRTRVPSIIVNVV